MFIESGGRAPAPPRPAPHPGPAAMLCAGPGSGPAPHPMLDLAGQRPGERVLLLGLGTLEIACALLRAGATEATNPAASADLAIMPLACTPSAVTQAIRTAQRFLSLGGRLVLARVPPTLLPAAAGRLARAGFGELRVRKALGHLTLVARRGRGTDRPTGNV